MDNKNRFAVPKRLRDQFGEIDLRELFVAPGMGQSLDLYSTAAFEKLANRFAEQSPTQTNIRNYKRLFYGRAENVELDGQGRIRIPDRLVADAGLSKEIVLIGVLDHVEVWDVEIWQKFLEKHNSEFDEMAAGVFD